MKAFLAIFGVSVLTLPAFAIDPQLVQRGKQEEQRACTPCHSLRLVNSQRLSQAAWGKEINKMIGWGAPVSDRKTLLDYLSQEYNPAKPLPPDELTANGVEKK